MSLSSTTFYFRKDPRVIADFTNCTFLMPAVSVGNIGQLTLDLFISTCKPEKVGYIYDEALLPVVGNDPFLADNQSCQLSTCCDVYWLPKSKVVFLQQRASFVQGKRKGFRTRLLDWLQSENFARIVLVSSTYSHLRTDQQISKNALLRFLSTDDLKPLLLKLPGWVELEDSPDMFDKLTKHIPGSGIAKTLLEDCKTRGMKLVVTLMFCSEGDNSPDALVSACYVNQLLKLKESDWVPDEQHSAKSFQQWTIPSSWRLNFGNSYNQNIY